jgi:hypothetical protein
VNFFGRCGSRRQQVVELDLDQRATLRQQTIEIFILRWHDCLDHPAVL